MVPNDEHSTDAAESTAEPNGVVQSRQRQGRQQSESPSADTSSTMLPGLQEQISQALQPLMGNLRQQVAEAIKQEQSVSGGSQPAADATDSAAQGAPGDLQGSLRSVFAQVTSAIRTAVDWIVRMARTLFATVREWLQRLSAALSKLAISMALSGAKSAARPVLKAVVNKGVEALEQRSKETLGSVRDNVAKPARSRASGTA